MEQHKLDRINALAALARTRELTPEEQEERAALRQEYVGLFKRSLTDTLEHTWVVDKKGNRKKLTKREENK